MKEIRTNQKKKKEERNKEKKTLAMVKLCFEKLLVLLYIKCGQQFLEFLRERERDTTNLSS